MNLAFLTGIAVVLLWIIFRNNKAVLWFDVRFLLGCMLVMVVRMFVLMDSPVSNNVPIFSVYPQFCRFLRKPLLYWEGIQINPMMLLRAGWLTGTLISAAFRINGYCAVQKRIRGYKELRNPKFDKIMERLNREFGKNTRFRLVVSNKVGTPYVFGIARPYITVPETEFTEEEIYFILKHEMLHYYRGDMLIRVVCETLKSIYWWNIFVYMLCKLVASMQEINVDFQVIKDLPELEQLKYPNCLAKVAREREMRRKESQWAIGFRKESPSTVYKRVNLILKNQEISRRKTTASFLLSAVILGIIVICPNIFTLEPYAIPDKHVDGSVGLKGGGIYYLDNKDGTYDIYIDGKYFDTTMEVFDESIPVYDSLEEIIGSD